MSVPYAPKPMVWLWALIIAVLFVGSCQLARADLFLETGASRYNAPRDTVWWQPSAYPYDDQFEGGYFRAGIREPIEMSDSLSIGFSVFSLGQYSLHALASYDEDEYVDGLCPAQCSAPVEWLTEGRILGAAATLSYRPVSWAVVEGGLSLYRQDFKLRVQDGAREIFTWQEHATGNGYLLGAAIEGRAWALGANLFHGSVERVFNRREFPAGAGKLVGALFVRRTW